MEKAVAPHSSTPAWRIPWTEEPGGLRSMGSLRVGYDWATLLSLFTFLHWRRKWRPTPVLLPGESQGWGAWWAAVYGVTQSRTQLKWLSSSSSILSNSTNGFILFLFTVSLHNPLIKVYHVNSPRNVLDKSGHTNGVSVPGKRQTKEGTPGPP